LVLISPLNELFIDSGIARPVLKISATLAFEATQMPRTRATLITVTETG